MEQKQSNTPSHAQKNMKSGPVPVSNEGRDFPKAKPENNTAAKPENKTEAKPEMKPEAKPQAELSPIAKLAEFAGNSVKEVAGGSVESLKKVGLSAESARDLSIELDRALAASRGLVAREKTVVYLGKLGSEITERLADYLVEWAETNQARLHVKVNGVSTRTPWFAGAGAGLGGFVGYRFGGKAGAALGALFGATLGSLVSCMDVHFHTDAEGNTHVAVA